VSEPPVRQVQPVLYGPSNMATSETETFAHYPDARITSGRRAPLKAASTPTSPKGLSLNHHDRPDDARWRAPNQTRARHELRRACEAATSYHGAAIFQGAEKASCAHFTQAFEPPRVPKGKRVGRRPYNE